MDAPAGPNSDAGGLVVESRALIMASATCFSEWRSQGGTDDACHREPHTPGKTRGVQGGTHPFASKIARCDRTSPCVVLWHTHGTPYG